ncbi:hypothetical protein ABID82_001300 [Methylobacterium sp. PvP062]|jgi:hypothetical protein|uniref:Uncharacterized protein n=3 Tax=Methylobacterium TaxID=407 RepID=A0AA37WVV7_9HYPH|nr:MULTISPECIES: hypothetical protein [Methylobacterium]AWV15216.1 hypothetical protein A3862_06555 [Methylobacterium sp. XJLW]MBE7196187.1 hypothetical protein [Parafilimonas terrae]MCX7334615.1 hypothetical protein [Hyphomicrobiales bacterium]MBP2498095.1 hypothetical protein [Methylobacterium sp. PvP105]MBP2502034.1 hypothetical protein [Methylobacterium sp. PvP109]
MDEPDNGAAAAPSPRDEAEFHRFTRLQLSCSDFAQAMSAATFLLQELEDDVVYGLPAWRKFRCYETTMVVAYARPFSQSKGRVPKLGWKALGVELSSAELALHEKVVAHRNSLYGHSDADAVELRMLYLHEVFNHNGAEMNLFMPRFEERPRFDLDEIFRIYELCSKLNHHAFMACQDLGKQFRDRFEPLPMNLSDPD